MSPEGYVAPISTRSFRPSLLSRDSHAAYVSSLSGSILAPARWASALNSSLAERSTVPTAPNSQVSSSVPGTSAQFTHTCLQFLMDRNCFPRSFQKSESSTAWWCPNRRRLREDILAEPTRSPYDLWRTIGLAKLFRKDPGCCFARARARLCGEMERSPPAQEIYGAAQRLWSLSRLHLVTRREDNLTEASWLLRG